LNINHSVNTETGGTFTGAQFWGWPDALPAATSDSYGWQRRINANGN